jgi:hypothetical protein
VLWTWGRQAVPLPIGCRGGACWNPAPRGTAILAVHGQAPGAGLAPPCGQPVKTAHGHSLRLSKRRLSHCKQGRTKKSSRESRRYPPSHFEVKHWRDGRRQKPGVRRARSQNSKAGEVSTLNGRAAGPPNSPPHLRRGGRRPGWCQSGFSVSTPPPDPLLI